MNVAVCLPQVPSPGGAEILADELTAGSSGAGTSAESSRCRSSGTRGERVLTHALVWRLLDLDEVEGRADRPGDRDEVSVVRRAPSEQGRLARAPVPPGVRARRHALSASSTTGRRTGRRCGRSSGSTGVALGEAGAVRDLAERRRPAVAVGGLDAEVLRRLHSPSTTAARVRRLRPLGRPARRAKRVDLLLEAAGAKALRVVVAGDGPDRGRLEELAALAGPRRPRELRGRVSDAELADLYATCLAVYYAPIDEDLGLVPYEAFLAEKPVVTTHDAGGPLEVVTDRETGLVVAPEPRGARECARVARPASRRGARVGRARQGDRRDAHLGPRGRQAGRLVRVGYYSPLPPERSGIADYSALLLPSSGAGSTSTSCGP